MGRFAAIGGGTYEEIDPIASEIVRLSKKPVPNVLFIGTALEDSTNPLTSCKKTFKRVAPGCIVKKLSIIRSTYTEAQIDELFSWADIIFVGGGNTVYMLEKWEEFGITERLKKAFSEDSAVLCGVSAGAICWFSKGYTDSDSFTGSENWTYRVIEPGIDLYPGFFCPHYSDGRGPGFDSLAAEEALEGIALEDGTAMIFDQGQVHFMSALENAHAWCFHQGRPKEQMC